MATCDTLEVDLSRVDINVTLEQYPCIDVEILSPDITIEALTVANQGPKGDQGPIGPIGPIGPVGPSGPVGPTGTQGVQGSAGPKGDLGPQGATGPQGAQGVAGPQGAQGPTGSTGPQGPVGPQGPIGQGLTPKGTVANSGSLPASGNTAGDIWITSDTGHGWSWDGTKWVDMGPFQGPVGATGPQGTTGATGATGPQGPKGADSTVPGPQGPPGATGSQGPQGATGAAGAAATIAVGTTTTGTPGTNAAVNNSGSSSAAVFNFTIPAGVQGAAGAQGSTGPQGPPGPTAVSTDAGNIATLGSDSKILVPQSSIWSVRLRTFNAAGNPTFEVDQRNSGTLVPNSQAWAIDRWWNWQVGTARYNSQQTSGNVVVPGTNFLISSKFLRITLTTAQATMGASDVLGFAHNAEGPRLRELINDVHSISLLVRSSVAPLKFGLALRDAAGTATRSLAKLCTISSANTWTLIQLPNLPIWAAGGTFPITPGASGYGLVITLGCGSTMTVAANDTWQNGNFIGALGQDNFAAQAVNSTFDIAYISHEPGAQSSNPPMDCPFDQNLLECQRYYQTSYPWGITKGTATAAGSVSIFTVAGTWPQAWIPFSQRMAKSPSLNGYSPSTGTLNTVRDSQANTDRSTSGTINASDNGFSGFSLSSTNGSNAMYIFHYTADTGL